MSNQNDEQYVIQYVRQAMSSTTIDPSDASRANGLREALESVHLAHKQGGPQAVRQALPTIYKHTPQLAELVNRPALIRPIDELKGRARPRWLIEGEIQENSLTVMYGASGTGKTFLALGMAEQIAQDAPVIYVVTEGIDTFGDRVEAWEKHNRKASGGLTYISDTVNLLNPDDVERLIIEAQSLHPKLIVFDTLAMCMVGGDENSAKDMGFFMQACRQIIRELNTAVLVVHHTGKSGSSERGSSALRGNADMMIEIVDNDGVMSIRCDKSRNTAGFDTRYCRLLPVQLGLPAWEGAISKAEMNQLAQRSSCVVIESDRVITGDHDVTENQKQVIELLAGLWSEGARSRDLEKAVNMAPRTLYNVLGTLNRRGLIDRDGRYDPWVLSEKGDELAFKLGYTKHE